MQSDRIVVTPPRFDDDPCLVTQPYDAKNNNCKHDNEHDAKHLESAVIMIGSRFVISGITDFLAGKSLLQFASCFIVPMLHLFVIARHDRSSLSFSIFREADPACCHVVTIFPKPTTIAPSQNRDFRAGLHSPDSSGGHIPSDLEARFVAGIDILRLISYLPDNEAARLAIP